MRRPTFTGFVSPEVFRSKLSENRVLPVAVRAVGCVEKSGEGDAVRMDFTLSTEAVDRGGDVVRQGGWQLDNFKKNPVVLWAHASWEPPVGRAPNLELVLDSAPRLVARGVEFQSREVNERGWSVGQMYAKGFLNAVSVGFQPKTWAPMKEGRGLEFTAQELLEFSAVPVPANQEALVSAKSAGIPLGWFLEWADETIDKARSNDEARQSLIVPVSFIEELRKTIAPTQVQVKADVGEDEPEEDDDAVVEALGALTDAVLSLKESMDANTKALTAGATKAEPTPEPSKAAPTPPARPSSLEVQRLLTAEIRNQLAASGRVR